MKKIILLLIGVLIILPLHAEFPSYHEFIKYIKGDPSCDLAQKEMFQKIIATVVVITGAATVGGISFYLLKKNKNEESALEKLEKRKSIPSLQPDTVDDLPTDPDKYIVTQKPKIKKFWKKEKADQLATMKQALNTNNEETIKKLIKHGMLKKDNACELIWDVNSVDGAYYLGMNYPVNHLSKLLEYPKDGKTRLMQLIEEKADPRLIKALLYFGAKVNVVEKEGTTLLMKCVDRPDIFVLLVESGANLRAKDKNNKAVLDSCYIANQKEFLGQVTKYQEKCRDAVRKITTEIEYRQNRQNGKKRKTQFQLNPTVLEQS